jgi:PTS hybrid protein
VSDPWAPSRRATVTLRNPFGLHARPAAVLARMVADLDAEVRINGANAASILELMKLGASGGLELTVTATGAQAEEAVRAVVVAITAGLGEA